MHRSRRITTAVLGIATGLILATSGARAMPDRSGDGQSDLGRGTSTPAAVADAADNHGLQRFTAGGHVLGFGLDGYYVSNGSYALRVDFVGANAVRPAFDGASAGESGGKGMDDRGDKGVDAGAGNTAAAPALTAVTYSDLWAGIRLTYDAPGSGIARSTWHVAPGADPGAIRLRYNRPVTVNPDGSLTAAFERGAITESAPVAWQAVGGRRVPVAVRFELGGAREIGFAVGAYDPELALVIDPTLVWNTFMGAAAVSDVGRDIAVDGSGNVYVTGLAGATWGGPVRAHSGNFDAFVVKLSPDGALTWNTFLGGSANDHGRGVAVDGSGNVYVGGISRATWGSPVRSYSAGDDAFAAKLSSSGALTWNTFLGSSGFDRADGIAVDGSGNSHLAGCSNATWGSPVRAYSAGCDAIAVKLDSGGTLTWNTFLGGSGEDSGHGIAVDGSGNVSVAGGSDATWGSPVRAYTAGHDAFAAKLSSNGDLSWNTFLGGSGNDYGEGIAVDGSGNMVVTGDSGATWGSPVRAYTAGHDAFAAKLSSNGDLSWNTFLGDSGDDRGWAVTVDGSGNVYVAGTSDATWGSPWRSYSALGDGFAARLGSGGALAWNAFLGGSESDGGDGIAVDGSANVYVTGTSRDTWGSPVQGHSGAGCDDAYAAKIDDPPPTSTPTSTPTHTPTASNMPTPTDTATTTPTATHTPTH